METRIKERKQMLGDTVVMVEYCAQRKTFWGWTRIPCRIESFRDGSITRIYWTTVLDFVENAIDLELEHMATAQEQRKIKTVVSYIKYP